MQEPSMQYIAYKLYFVIYYGIYYCFRRAYMQFIINKPYVQYKAYNEVKLHVIVEI